MLNLKFVIYSETTIFISTTLCFYHICCITIFGSKAMFLMSQKHIIFRSQNNQQVANNPFLASGGLVVRIHLPSKRCGFDPWVGRIPWRRKSQPTPVFLPGKSHGQRSLAATVHRVAKRHTQLSTPTQNKYNQGLKSRNYSANTKTK